MVSRFFKWLRFDPVYPRRKYLLRSLWIIIALIFTAATGYLISLDQISIYWFLAADLAIIVACGSAIMPFIQILDGLGGGIDYGAILLLVLIPFIIPCLAPLILVWSLFQAWRAPGQVSERLQD